MGTTEAKAVPEEAEDANPAPEARAQRGVADWRGALRWALVALFVAGSLVSFGSFVDDEVLQAIAFENLLDGHLFIHEEPEHLWKITEDVEFRHRAHTMVGDVGIPKASALLNFLAVPVAGLLLLVDALVPVRYALLAAWGLLGFHVSRWGVDAVRAGWGKGRMEWQRRGARVPAWMWLGWGWVALTAWGALRLPALDLGLWISYIALQLTNMLLFALLAGLLWMLVARTVPDGRRWAGTAVVLLLVSPALFWGMGAKYHTVLALLAVAVALLYHTGLERRQEALVFAAVALAGLAVLGNKMGIALVGSVGLVHAAALTRGGPWHWQNMRHVLVFGASAVAGMVPWIVYSSATYTAPWSTIPRAGGRTGGGASGGAGEGAGAAADHIAGQWQFQDLGSVLRNLWDAHVDASGFQGAPSAVWLIAPWAVVAVLALLRPGKTIAVRLLAVHLVLTWVIVGPRLPTQGSGFDPRFLAGSWPAYAVLFVWGVHDMDWDKVARRRFAVTALVGGLVTMALLAVLAASGVLFAVDDRQLSMAQPWISRITLLLILGAGTASYFHTPWRRWLPLVVGVALVPGLIWMLDTTLVHHRRLPGLDGADAAAFLTPVATWLWDAAWDLLVPCVQGRICEVR